MWSFYGHILYSPLPMNPMSGIKRQIQTTTKTYWNLFTILATAGGKSKGINFPSGYGSVEKIFFEAWATVSPTPSHRLLFPPLPLPINPNQRSSEPRRRQTVFHNHFLAAHLSFPLPPYPFCSSANLEKQQQQNKQITKTMNQRSPAFSSIFLYKADKCVCGGALPFSWDATYLQIPMPVRTHR